MTLFLVGLALLLVGFARPQAKFNEQGRGDRRAGGRRLGLDGRQGRQADPPGRGRCRPHVVRREAPVQVPRLSRDVRRSQVTVRVPPTSNRATLIQRPADEDRRCRDSDRRRRLPALLRWRRRQSARARKERRILRRRSCSSPTERRPPASSPRPRAAQAARKAGIEVSTVSLGTAHGTGSLSHSSDREDQQPEVQPAPADPTAAASSRQGNRRQVLRGGLGEPVEAGLQGPRLPARARQARGARSRSA